MNRIGAYLGDTLDPIIRLSHNSRRRVTNSFIFDDTILYGVLKTSSNSGAKSIENSDSRSGGKPRRYYRHTSKAHLSPGALLT